ncbi:MAG: alanine racemase [Acidimicrobiales bacterium]
MAPTRLYLDLSAMEENVTIFRRLVGPSVRIMAMVKALAYGTDAQAVSLGLHDSGVDWLGVGNADEGIALRGAGVTLPILVMLGTEDEVEKLVRHRLTPLVYSEAMLAAITGVAKEASQPVAVHVEVDTGMHRAGLDWNDAAGRLDELTRLGKVRVEGLMTHLASADDPAKDELTRLQLERFDAVVADVHRLGLRPLLHAAATAGTIRIPAARYDLVRIGLGLFGLHPSPATARELALAPVLSLVSRIVQVIDVPPGEGVGYGGTYVAPAKGGRVGVVPAGYHDCVPRSFSNFGYVVVAGAQCGIIGAVSMDSMTVDLTECPSAAVGSDVLIYGRGDTDEVPLEEVSRAIGTIPYEVMARVGPRVQRVFTRH